MSAMTTWLVSFIQYRPDVSKPDVRPIQLGVAVEVRGKDFGILGLFARESLFPAELEKLDFFSRDQIESPKDYLKSEIERAMKEAPTEVLGYLAKEHRWALEVSVPRELPARQSFANLKNLDQILSAIPKVLKARAKELANKEFSTSTASKKKKARQGRKSSARQSIAATRRSSFRGGYVVETVPTIAA